MEFTAEHYTPNACWSQDWTDSTGHIVGGFKVNLDVTIKNLNADWVPRLWISVRPTDLTREVNVLSTSWKSSHAVADGSGLILGAPAIPRGTSTYRMSVLFVTAFDAHYEVRAAAFDAGLAPTDATDWQATWSQWTSSVIC